MDDSEAEGFAQQWVGDWNSRDVERVLRHFSDDVVFTSATAARVVPETAGVVIGKEALRRYWTLALAINPDLMFTLLGVYTGISMVVINYRNQHGVSLCEVYEFDKKRIRRGHATSAVAGG